MSLFIIKTNERIRVIASLRSKRGNPGIEQFKNISFYLRHKSIRYPHGLLRRYAPRNDSKTLNLISLAISTKASLRAYEVSVAIQG
ncbi:MAG: hypothetical protein KKE11_06900 [Gammaproteobacteria bacterium]|nr:hypothetical protein [Gammaproteobacteria bacterium]